MYLLKFLRFFIATEKFNTFGRSFYLSINYMEDKRMNHIGNFVRNKGYEEVERPLGLIFLKINVTKRFTYREIITCFGVFYLKK